MLYYVGTSTLYIILNINTSKHFKKIKNNLKKKKIKIISENISSLNTVMAIYHFTFLFNY